MRRRGVQGRRWSRNGGRCSMLDGHLEPYHDLSSLASCLFPSPAIYFTSTHPESPTSSLDTMRKNRIEKMSSAYLPGSRHIRRRNHEHGRRPLDFTSLRQITKHHKYSPKPIHHLPSRQIRIRFSTFHLPTAPPPASSTHPSTSPPCSKTAYATQPPYYHTSRPHKWSDDSGNPC